MQSIRPIVLAKTSRHHESAQMEKCKDGRGHDNEPVLEYSMSGVQLHEKRHAFIWIFKQAGETQCSGELYAGCLIPLVEGWPLIF